MNHFFYEQTYGVEIEMTGISRRSAARVIAEYFGTTSSHVGGCYDTYTATSRDGRTWKAMADSSIRATGGRDTQTEVVTPILRYEDMDDLQNIVRALRTAGATVNDSCGIHVHVGAEKQTAYTLTCLCNLFLKRQALINDALDNWDRSRWCKQLCPALVDAMRKAPKDTQTLADIWYGSLNDGGDSYRSAHYNQTRYHGINLHAYYTKGTVEYRLFNSTLHAGKIKAYVQFCLALSTYALRQGEEMPNGDCNARFQSSAHMTPDQKYRAMMNFLEDRLQLTGREFATCRLHMTSTLASAAGIAA